MRALALALLALTPALAQEGPDRDGDGLSDFHEVTKYRTDPDAADSDGDGVPDGEGDERREWTYTVRSVLQVAPVPISEDVLCDDYQDARVLDVTDEYVELEVIHYPLATAHEHITPRGAGWLADAALEQPQWLAPGVTSDWDETLRAAVRGRLAAAGIDLEGADDAAFVRAAARWLVEHAESQGGFTTFSSALVDGEVQILPGMEQAAHDGVTQEGRSVEEQWRRELFASGMFETGARGSCTSSAIYLAGTLRAAGVPTRIVLTTPLIDASDPREVALVARLRHPAVRRAVEQAAQRFGQSWASHTFNEVYVGGRWQRLNYHRLGQPSFDPGGMGLMTHVATVHDWLDGEFAASWGLRQARRGDDAFGHSNPYSALTLSDRIGAHADPEALGLGEEPERLAAATAPAGPSALTIVEALWWADPRRPATVDMRLDDPLTAGHVVVRVAEGVPGFDRFYASVDKSFQLLAPGAPPVPARAARGHWFLPEAGIQHFYLRIDPEHMDLVQPGARYSLVARNDAPASRWVVGEGVELVEPEGAQDPAESPAGEPGWSVVGYRWGDDPTLPFDLPDGLKLLLEVSPREGSAFDDIRDVAEAADREFDLLAVGQEALRLASGVGGISMNGRHWLVLRFSRVQREALREGVRYQVAPRNRTTGPRWHVQDGLVVVRGDAPGEEQPQGEAAAWTLHGAWFHSDPACPTGQIRNLGEPEAVLVDVGPRDAFDRIKDFTREADQTFFLVRPGLPSIALISGVGGLTSGDRSYLVLSLEQGSWEDLRPGQSYSLVARNARRSLRWVTPKVLRLTRPE